MNVFYWKQWLSPKYEFSPLILCRANGKWDTSKANQPTDQPIGCALHAYEHVLICYRTKINAQSRLKIAK